MKPKIIAKNRKNLLELIKQEMDGNGYCCDLNHINVSKVKDMKEIFKHSNFNGDISNWDVSQVENMNSMFWGSVFVGDISKWDTSSVIDMSYMFAKSEFNGDITQWDVSNVCDMGSIFALSKFDKDLSTWKPYSLMFSKFTFEQSSAPVPYWSTCESKEERQLAIKEYIAKTRYEELDNLLVVNGSDTQKRMKI